jgi:three-Cys-motif partner protein
MLSAHVMSRSDVSVLNADANEVLPRDVFPQYSFTSYRRAFCLLDPYTHKQLYWTTIEAAGKNGSIDLLLHFPTMPMNRGALHRNGDVSPDEAAAMTRFWGDDSWREAVYVKRHGLFDFATAFCERLTNVAGFKGTSKPIPMKNTRGAIMYYLIFALPHDTAIRAAKSVAKYFIEYPSAVYRTRKAEHSLQDAG